MRRKIKRKKTWTLKGLLFLFLVSLMGIGIGYSLLSQTLELKGTASIIKKENPTDKIRFSYTKNTWGSNPYTTQYDITVENISSNVIEDWTIVVSVPKGTELAGCWNAICQLQDDKLYFKKESHNSSIGIDGKVTFGIQLKTMEEMVELENPSLTNSSSNLPEEEISSDLKVTYQIKDQWNSGNMIQIMYQVSIENIGEKTIQSWNLKTELGEHTTRQSSWEVNYIESGTTVIFSNVSYNGTIAPNTSVSFGFTVQTTDQNFQPKTISIQGENR